jgi:hypothetical protein
VNRTANQKNSPGGAECLAARRALEPGASGQSDESVKQAQQHVQQCATCQRVVALSERLDLRIRHVCRNVEIPAGLKERLHSAMGIDAAPQVEAAETRAVPAPAVVSSRPTVATTRRKWLKLAGATAASLMAGGGAWFWLAGRVDSVNLDELCRHAVDISADTAELPPFATFAGGVRPKPPVTMTNRPLVVPPKKLVFKGQAVAVYPLSWQPRGRGPAVQGMLLVVPASAAAELPAATTFLDGGPSYRQKGYCSTSWVEGEFAYICCVVGGGANLEYLKAPRVVPV